jgi:hypothetical protein
VLHRSAAFLPCSGGLLTGLKGDERLLFIADKLRIKTKEDYRQVGRLIAEGRKQMRK